MPLIQPEVKTEKTRPIHWIRFYAPEDDEKEIARLVEENKKQSKEVKNIEA